MGLAGPRNRRKIQFDPNNTKWSRDETTFGQRILRAQGWEPGKFLGAENAAHAHLHTAASAAPINVLMKDDTLGLGAKPKHKQNAECTGLDVFKDLLGRLNGKTEEKIEEERQVRSHIKTNLYVERKYGLMRFVSGGLLVGDQMEDLKSTTIKTENSDDSKPTATSEDGAASPAKKQKKEKKSKKRKAEDSDSTESLEAIPEKKRKKRSKDGVLPEESATIVEAGESNRRKDKSKKSKRRDTDDIEPAESEKKGKKKKSKKSPERGIENDNAPIVSEDAETGKAKSKKDKSKKEKKKEKKRKQSDTAESSTDTPTSALGVTPQESGVSTPIASGTSTPQVFSARHYARSRNIASKRMAMADMQALNQIFMVKPVS
ncbi:hypothetical protein GGS26DRAFT_554334 [Hypomontagnella submonticulosa]|nr:hypothetical protein GGS26DRAFT_554334 [Hypomontagnella submonticulosa]